MNVRIAAHNSNKRNDSGLMMIWFSNIYLLFIQMGRLLTKWKYVTYNLENI